MWFNYSYLCDEAPIKLRWASRWQCFVHDVTRHSWEEAMLSRALEGEVSWIPPRYPFFWLALIIPLSYNKITVLSVTCSWVLWIILVDYYNWEWLSKPCSWCNCPNFSPPLTWVSFCRMFRVRLLALSLLLWSTLSLWVMLWPPKVWAADPEKRSGVRKNFTQTVQWVKELHAFRIQYTWMPHIWSFQKFSVRFTLPETSMISKHMSPIQQVMAL